MWDEERERLRDGASRWWEEDNESNQLKTGGSQGREVQNQGEGRKTD